MTTYYIIVGEDYECNKCKRRVISWSQTALDQLDTTERSKFPCILTERYACDLKVVRMMRQRTLGNSSSLAFKQIAENHGETYLDKCRQYATHFLAFKKSAAKGLVTIPTFVKPPPVKDIPRHRWFIKVYQLDVISRLDYQLAELTSVTGDILKIDFTKKITNKLAGWSRGTANWATNVGNEHGQVLMSVLTEGEGEGLKKMLDGIVARYRTAGVPPPKALYTDRDCCDCQCIKKFFNAWPFLNVRLDSWHFIRRFPNGCTTDKHQLFGPFMTRLSHCIFKVDGDDYALLMRAKRAELVRQNVPNPTDEDVIKHISRDEVNRHCKRATRGTTETTSLIADLIASLDGEKGLDTSGVPLIDSVKMSEIWARQSQHVACLQDPAGIRLYTQVSTVKKGGIELPVYKCARGSTSLENFHLHMARFIPGTLAKDTNFQVYLLDGIFRWNADRAAEAIASRSEATVVPRTYSGSLKHQTNMLWQELCGRPFFPNFKPPGKYTGELVGVQYLYNQTGQELPSFAQTREQLEQDGDLDLQEEGFADEGFIEMEQPPVTPPEETALLPPPEETAVPPTPGETALLPPPEDQKKKRPILHIPSQAEYHQMNMDTVEGLRPPTETSMPAALPASGSHLTPSLEDTDQSSDVLGADNVPGYDKVLNLAQFLVELRDERALSLDKIKRLIYLWEQLSTFDKNRTKFPRRYTKKPWSGKFGGRGKHVTPGVETITKYNKEDKVQEQKILLQGLNMPKPEMTGSGLPEARQKPEVLRSSQATRFEFSSPPCTAGLARKRTSRKRKGPTPVQGPSVTKQPSLLPIKPSPEATIVRFPVVMNQEHLLILPGQQAALPPLPPLPATPATPSPTTSKKTRAYKTPEFVKCSKCGENRKNSTTHQSYMFKIFWENSENTTFAEWRKAVKQKMDEEKKLKKKK